MSGSMNRRDGSLMETPILFPVPQSTFDNLVR